MSLNEFESAPPGGRPERPLPLDLLSSTELRIVHHVARGARNADIARELGITETSVQRRLGSIYTKLQVKNRVKLLVRLFGT